MQKFKNKYRIPSARLAGWDYSAPGSYFITICTKNRDHFFGEIIDEEMYLNEIGVIADNCWSEIPDHFQNAILGEFVIMPNHVHGIIIIDEPVETGHALSHDKPILGLSQNDLAGILPNETGRAPSIPRNGGKNTISDMVGSFKSAVTKLSRPINPRFGWQSRFHDHIIRSHDDLVRISNYIKNNPANWNSDKFYKR